MTWFSVSTKHCILPVILCATILDSRSEFYLAIDVLFGWTSLSQEASASIAGVGVFGKLKFESGIHRVQVLATASHIKSMNTLYFYFQQLLTFIFNSEFLWPKSQDAFIPVLFLLQSFLRLMRWLINTLVNQCLVI